MLDAETRHALYATERELEQTRCEKCGEFVEVGAWPFCPHGKGANSIVPDDVPGGFIAENGFDRPTRFDSRSAHERALAERGLEIRAKNAGPNDKICPRWDSVDLEAAAALVTRGIRTPNDTAERWPRATEPITVTLTGGTIRQTDL